MIEDFPDETIEQGIAIVRGLLGEWSSTQDGEDVVMSDSDPNVQFEDLQRCVERYRPQMESNPWLQSIIASL